MDAFLDILRATRLSGGIVLEAELTAPWCVTSHIGPEDCTPFAPEPANIIAYHYVSSGRVLVEIEGHAPIAATGGELVLLPRNDPHRIGSHSDQRAVSC